MANTEDNKNKPIIRQIPSRLKSWLSWLTKPANSLPESLIHQSVLLAWTLMLVITLALASIIVIPSSTPQRMGYIGLILVLVFVFLAAFVVNRLGRYRLAAVLTILGAIAAPWSSLVLDPAILQGDLIPLNFVTVPILLSSILLPPWITAIVAGIQMVALVHVLSLMPATANINWVSFLTFVLIIFAISILTSYIRQRDLKQIAHQKALLEKSEAKLREQSIRDHLTGLYNRRYLDETLAREIRRAEREAFPVGIIMLDLDHFKRLNDTFGHAAGDVVLHEIGVLLKGKIRYADIVCRYGGEEFVVVMPGASLQITVQRAEDLREEVSQLDLQYDNHNLGKITISAGVAIFPNHGATAEAVLQCADSALYAAKHAGRDRVVVAS